MSEQSAENKGEIRAGEFAPGPPPSSGPKSPPAYCPKCKGEIGATDPTCMHCGYDFPFGGSSRPFWRSKSVFGDAILILGTIVAIILIFLAIIAAIGMLAAGNIPASLLFIMTAVFLMAAAVTFLRVLRYGPP